MKHVTMESMVQTCNGRRRLSPQSAVPGRSSQLSIFKAISKPRFGKNADEKRPRCWALFADARLFRGVHPSRRFRSAWPGLIRPNRTRRRHSNPARPRSRCARYHLRTPQRKERALRRVSQVGLLAALRRKRVPRPEPYEHQKTTHVGG